MRHYGLLVLAGLLAGTMNAVAGGGSFVGFPAMVFAGLPPIAANATSTVALFPGTVASTWAYRADLTGIAGISLKVLLPISLAGGLVGAILLLVTPGGAFDLVIPWLLLLATLTFAGGRRLGEWLRRYARIGRGPLLVIQFILSIYGGYFGGAIGLMMMAVWTLLNGAELKAFAPVRTLLVSAANGMAVLCFLAAGVVRLPEMLAMMLSAVAGGYYGARFARHLPPNVLRVFVVLLSAVVTTGFFLRKY
ncbi:sulfite exporter TauE/SafE family protein [Rhodopila sp.]|uniref:sulfite exporter TauE/SafE family protein n=1 Tax=Rhodopila sp. TaxID=2480087 RepID=UPI003D0A769D